MARLTLSQRKEWLQTHGATLQVNPALYFLQNDEFFPTNVTGRVLQELQQKYNQVETLLAEVEKEYTSLLAKMQQYGKTVVLSDALLSSIRNNPLRDLGDWRYADWIRLKQAGKLPLSKAETYNSAYRQVWRQLDNYYPTVLANLVISYAIGASRARVWPIPRVVAVFNDDEAENDSGNMNDPVELELAWNWTQDYISRYSIPIEYGDLVEFNDEDRLFWTPTGFVKWIIDGGSYEQLPVEFTVDKVPNTLYYSNIIPRVSAVESTLTLSPLVPDDNYYNSILLYSYSLDVNGRSFTLRSSYLFWNTEDLRKYIHEKGHTVADEDNEQIADLVNFYIRYGGIPVDENVLYI